MASDALSNDAGRFGPEPAAPALSVREILEKVFAPLASLKLTVTLMALGILLVLFGTLAQSELNEFMVAKHVFRTWVTFVEFKWFFPPKIFPGMSETVQGGFWFPGGWIIGGMMAANLLAAHGIRFTVQAKNWRLAAGLGIIALGAVLTYLVIVAGPDKDEFNEAAKLNWTDIHGWIKTGLGLLLVAAAARVVVRDRSRAWELLGLVLLDTALAGMFGYVLVDDLPLWTKLVSAGVWLGMHVFVLMEKGPRRVERTVLLTAGSILAGVLGYLLFRGNDTVIDTSGIRILWQLLKGATAGLVLLTGCILVFRKRAGVVLLHAGLLLMMSNELVVYGLHEENQMQLVEGESKNYVENYNAPELAFVRRVSADQNDVVALPLSLMSKGQVIRNPELPVDVELVDFWENTRPTDPRRDKPLTKEQSPATAGKGLEQPMRPTEINKRKGDDGQDMPAAFVRFLEKGTGNDLGVYLIGYGLDYYGDTPHSRVQSLSVDKQSYFFSLRPKRSYRSYTISLISTKRENYPGTTTPKDFRSTLKLNDPTHHVSARDYVIYMNNPLHYGGETFYQSGHNVDPDTATGISNLQIVANVGWMIPYVGCMIVVTGMAFHFLGTLSRFIRRRDDELSGLTGRVADKETTKGAAALTPQARAAAGWPRILIPAAAVTVCLAWFIPRAIVPSAPPDAIDLYGAGEISGSEQGRTKPLDSIARNMLRVLAQREVVEDGQNDKQPAIRWALDVITRPEEGEKYKIFRIDNDEMVSALQLPANRKELRYTAAELRAVEPVLEEEAENARDVPPRERSGYHKRILDLFDLWQAYNAFRDALTYADAPAAQDNLTTLSHFALGSLMETDSPDRTPLLIPLNAEDQPWASLASYAGVHWVDRLIKQYGGSQHLLDSLLAEKRGPLFDRIVQKGILKQELEELKKAADDQAKSTPDAKVEDLDGKAGREAAKKKWAVRSSEDREKITDEFREMYVVRSLEAIFHSPIERGCLDALDSRAGPKDPSLDDKQRRQATEKLWASMGDERRASFRQLLLQFVLTNEPQKIVETRGLLPALPPAASLLEILKAYRDGNGAAFQKNLAEYRDEIKEIQTSGLQGYSDRKDLFEAYFNYLQPFGIARSFYWIALALTAAGWLGWFKAFNRAAFSVIAITFLLHTFALAVRIYLSGRPPVTNLYSSAVFIGWGGVLIGLILEMHFGRSLGNFLAAASGLITLQIAEFLALDRLVMGETLGVMQAVLDSNFWLATHVVCISTGYTVTYVAGLLGIVYVVLGVFTPYLTATVGRELYRMIYGTVCFAILFSFFGTVLGGLWGDDSWGRFWGWDPKENGALIIVLWNTLVLHARWDGMAKERGLALLAIFGNVVTSWSYFGVNQLGLGRHAYGFTDGVVQALGIVVAIHLGLIALGSLPKNLWWSVRAQKAAALAGNEKRRGKRELS